MQRRQRLPGGRNARQHKDERREARRVQRGQPAACSVERRVRLARRRSSARVWASAACHVIAARPSWSRTALHTQYRRLVPLVTTFAHTLAAFPRARLSLWVAFAARCLRRYAGEVALRVCARLRGRRRASAALLAGGAPGRQGIHKVRAARETSCNDGCARALRLTRDGDQVFGGAWLREAQRRARAGPHERSGAGATPQQPRSMALPSRLLALRLSTALFRCFRR